MTQETRHYIAVTELGRLTATVGPATPNQFTTSPTEPIKLGDATAYPVSAEIAAEWGRDEECAR